MSIQIPVTFDSANRKRDKTVGLRFTTNCEISTQNYMAMDMLIQNSGWLLFKSNEMQAAEVPELPADEAFGKMTLSQEMRWYLKKLWEQNNEGLEWSDYYKSRMRLMIEMLKQRLD